MIVKTGEKMDTEYQVIPQPKKKFDEGIVKMAKDMDIRLEALFENKDPFGTDDNEGKKIAEDAVKEGL